MLMPAGLALAAPAHYQYRTEVNPDGTLTVYAALPGGPMGSLTGGWVQFTDPDWRSQSTRFYRVRGQ